MMLAANIDLVWDRIVDGVRDVAQKTNAEWSAEDILASVKKGKAFLFMDPSDMDSFVVMSEYTHPYLDARVLVVDIAYNMQGDAIDRYQGEIEAIAQEAGARYIEFSSPREGFKRVAAKHGYETVCTIYRKPLNG